MKKIKQIEIIFSLNKWFFIPKYGTTTNGRTKFFYWLFIGILIEY